LFKGIVDLGYIKISFHDASMKRSVILDNWFVEFAMWIRWEKASDRNYNFFVTRLHLV